MSAHARKTIRPETGKIVNLASWLEERSKRHTPSPGMTQFWIFVRIEDLPDGKCMYVLKAVPAPAVENRGDLVERENAHGFKVVYAPRPEHNRLAPIGWDSANVLGSFYRAIGQIASNGDSLNRNLANDLLAKSIEGRLVLDAKHI